MEARLVSFNESWTEMDGTCSAGMNPNNRPMRAASSTEKTSDATSILTVERSGMLNARRPSRRRVPPIAKITPSRPPQSDKTTFSVNSWRIKRRRPAPTAARMAISFCRVTLRANCRLATFAHTINIIMATAPDRMRKALCRLPVTCWSSDVSIGRRVLRSGCCFWICSERI